LNAQTQIARPRPALPLIGLALLALFGATWLAAPPELHRAVFVERWPFWIGGPAIGLFVLFFLWGDGRQLGVSSGYSDACTAAFDPSTRGSWRLVFLVGLVGGGAISALLAGGLSPTLAMGSFDTLVSASPATKALLFGGGGVLIGLGARLAGGCTSGHGIVGTALLAPASWLATAAFMVAGIITAHLVLA
jgi:uncharacterized membrane protein YedE/YeeE